MFWIFYSILPFSIYNFMTIVMDAVWDHLPALQCWEAYDDLVLERFVVPSSSSASGRGSRPSSSSGTTVVVASAASLSQQQIRNEALDNSDKAAVYEIFLLSAMEVSGHGRAKRAVEAADVVLKNGEPPKMSLSLSLGKPPPPHCDCRRFCSHQPPPPDREPSSLFSCSATTARPRSVVAL